MLTHGSLFSGVGGFNCGAEMAGIKTIWDCEILPYPRAVLRQHFPESKQYTDIKELTNPEYADIISGGFPCQDISIAKVTGQDGTAKGIKGERISTGIFTNTSGMANKTGYTRTPNLWKR